MGQTTDRPVILVQTRVRAMTTLDGMVDLNDTVTMGQVLIVDINSGADVGLFSHKYNTAHVKRVVRVVDTGGIIPLECLEVWV